MSSKVFYKVWRLLLCLRTLAWNRLSENAKNAPYMETFKKELHGDDVDELMMMMMMTTTTITTTTMMLLLMMMMMILCPKAGLLVFTPPWDEMSEVHVVSRCLPHSILWVSNLSKVATQWLEVDSNLLPSGCKAHHSVTA